MGGGVPRGIALEEIRPHGQKEGSRVLLSVQDRMVESRPPLLILSLYQGTLLH